MLTVERLVSFRENTDIRTLFFSGFLVSLPLCRQMLTLAGVQSKRCCWGSKACIQSAPTVVTACDLEQVIQSCTINESFLMSVNVLDSEDGERRTTLAMVSFVFFCL